MTEFELNSIIKPTAYDSNKTAAIVEALNQTLAKYFINSNIRICHFLAQILHESGAFKYSVEIWRDTEAQKRYDTNVKIGNSPEMDGDGYKFRGRGWIQLTGKTNYQLFGDAFGKDFINSPDLVSQEPYDSLAAGWFWNRRKLNNFADIDDIVTITKKINGGFNGLEQRKMWLSKARDVLPYEIKV